MSRSRSTTTRSPEIDVDALNHNLPGSSVFTELCYMARQDEPLSDLVAFCRAREDADMPLERWQLTALESARIWVNQPITPETYARMLETLTDSAPLLLERRAA